MRSNEPRLFEPGQKGNLLCSRSANAEHARMAHRCNVLSRNLRASKPSDFRETLLTSKDLGAAAQIGDLARSAQRMLQDSALAAHDGRNSCLETLEWNMRISRVPLDQASRPPRSAGTTLRELSRRIDAIEGRYDR